MAALVAVLLVTVAAPDADAAGRVRPYWEGGAIGLDTNLLSRSGVAAWAIDEYLTAHTPLPRLGTAFLAAERKYGINARFLLAAAMHESNSGRSWISRTKRNLFGYNAYDRDPARYATAFAGYASGIDQVAKFMKQSYLSRSGRWWGGAPTLRSMQRFWSSSGRWGENVSRIATRLKLDSLRKRHLRFGEPVLPDTVRTGDSIAVRLTWRGGRLPDGVTFRATWTHVAAEPTAAEAGADPSSATRDTVPPVIAATDADALRAGAGPGSVAPIPTPAHRPLQEPVTVKAKRTKLTKRTATVQVPVPDSAGEYVLSVSLRDRDGAALPRADKVRVPGTPVRVYGDWAVRYETEHLADSGLTVTVTNTGHESIPVSPLPSDVAERLGQADVRDTELVLRAFDREHPSGVDLKAIALTEPLAPGASVTLLVADLAAAAGDADRYLVPELVIFDDPLRLDATRAAGFWFRPD
jgi:hypothetical protein